MTRIGIYGMNEGRVTSLVVQTGDGKHYIMPLRSPCVATELPGVLEAVEGYFKCHSLIEASAVKQATLGAGAYGAAFAATAAIMAEAPKKRGTGRFAERIEGERRPWPDAVAKVIVGEHRPDWSQDEVDAILGQLPVGVPVKLMDLRQTMQGQISANQVLAVLELMAWRKLVTIERPNAKRCFVTKTDKGAGFSTSVSSVTGSSAADDSA